MNWCYRVLRLAMLAALLMFAAFTTQAHALERYYHGWEEDYHILVNQAEALLGKPCITAAEEKAFVDEAIALQLKLIKLFPQIQFNPKGKKDQQAKAAYDRLEELEAKVGGIPHCKPRIRPPHKTTDCLKCQFLVDDYNRAANNYDDAVRRHDPDQKEFRAEMAHLAKQIDDCEKNCGKQVGYIVPPRGNFALALLGGASRINFSTTYRSTGAQPPGDFGGHSTGGEALLELKYMWGPSGAWRPEVGVNVGGMASGTTTLFSYKVHPGAAGFVVAQATPGVEIEPYVGSTWGTTGGPTPWAWGSAGIMFLQNKLAVTSNQTGAGGTFESMSNTSWTPYFDLRAGISTVLCRMCVGGNPVFISISGNAAFSLQSQSINLPSTAFGFVETVGINRAQAYGAQVKFTTPLNGWASPPPP